MKIAVKNKSEWRYVDSKDLTVDGFKLSDVFERMRLLEKQLDSVLAILDKHFLVKEDNNYVVEVNGKLKLIKGLKIYQPPQENIDLKLYTVKDGKLVVDKKKIGGAVWLI